jgi:hypothetical protein
VRYSEQHLTVHQPQRGQGQQDQAPLWPQVSSSGRTTSTRTVSRVHQTAAFVLSRMSALIVPTKQHCFVCCHMCVYCIQAHLAAAGPAWPVWDSGHSLQLCSPPQPATRRCRCVAHTYAHTLARSTQLQTRLPICPVSTLVRCL